ncbi:MAG: class I SAM-dependent DNA methyltransferase [Proteobacteria bacterium]|nr:class I SAM-dependent DNA methyltransferase [Pseudomonadota bacterium]MBI3499187.1 class I SAM-dependent DNA methyltransferase [Pseudomonadota bacterium]
MDLEEFIEKWRLSELKETAAYQSHFIDLCAVLGEKAPTEVDADGVDYCFQKHVTKTVGSAGFVDVWKRGHFAVEYKGPGADLTKAYAQLAEYAPDLDNPPLLIVCDTKRFAIYTSFTNTPRVVQRFRLAEMRAPENLRWLRLAFKDPNSLKPDLTRETLTEAAATRFAELAEQLRERGYDAERVAHFVHRLLFCMFAEDIGLLPGKLVSRLLESCRYEAEQFEGRARELFKAMGTQGGGWFGTDRIKWFNGKLFDDDEALPLRLADIKLVLDASDLDWSHIEPSIFGTLFERGLNPNKRKELGKFYTDPGTIMKIVEPVILRPLHAEWEVVKAEIEDLQRKTKAAKSSGAATKLVSQARDVFAKFRDRLARVRVLDPACGSGNFLYLALRGLKELEHKVINEARALAMPHQEPRIGPEALFGIEINPFAAELARVAVWIGEIQWMLDHFYGLNRTPILRPLDQIACRDALVSGDGSEAEWPEAEFIVGNPPFVGNKRMIAAMGEAAATRVREAFDGRVPAGVDLVCYWFEKARSAIESGVTKRAGLVATQAIRQGANRKVLERVRDTGFIFEAWSDEPWVLDGAAVRVSMICVAPKQCGDQAHVDGKLVDEIYADLSSSAGGNAIDLTMTVPIDGNDKFIFMGTTKGGAFDVPGDIARRWLLLPKNPNARPNSDVVRPWVNGMDLVRRPSDKWIVDFGTDMAESTAALYEAPFEHVRREVQPERAQNRREAYRQVWWRFVEARTGMRQSLRSLTRFILTPRVSKHRIFVWQDRSVMPDSRLYAIAKDDDTTFGVLHSQLHEIWSLATCSWHGKGNDPTYNAQSCFGTFPFPEGLTPNVPAVAYADDPRAKRIAEAARALVEKPDLWLNPPELVRREPEVVPGFPDRILPVDTKAAAELKKRTLTNLYNQRPTWLANLHRALDEAVASAYGWPADLSEDEILARLFALNQARAGKAT